MFDNTNSPDRLDFLSPAIWLEVKERRQPISKRWHLLPEVPAEELFIIDELTVRKACEHFPFAYFVLRTLPEDRLFLVSISELVCVERVRVDRVGPTGVRKGKWLLDLREFKQLDSLENLEDVIREDIVAQHWKRSDALSLVPVRTV